MLLWIILEFLKLFTMKKIYIYLEFVWVFFPTFWQRTVKNFHITVILKRNEISILHVSLRKHYYKSMCIFFQRTKALFSCATPLLLYISFHKIPFHLKTSEFDVHLFSTLYINALFVSRSYQKAMHKQNIKTQCQILL